MIHDRFLRAVLMSMVAVFGLSWLVACGGDSFPALDATSKSSVTQIDLPDSRTSASDRSIASTGGDTCAEAVALDLSVSSVTGSTADADADETCTCQSNNGADVVYVFSIESARLLTFETEGFDTVLHLRSACEDIGTEIACDDDGAPNYGSRLDVDLQAGTYYLFVDGYSTRKGAYTLHVEQSCPAGTLLDPVTGECEKDDSPQGLTCADAKPLDLAASGTYSESTKGAGGEYYGSCRSNTSEERVYTFSLSQAGEVTFETSGFDTVLYLRSDCDDMGSEIACDDDGGSNYGSRISANLSAGTYYLFVDGYGNDSGTFQMSMDAPVSGCQPGYQDNDGDGNCLPSCQTAGYDCSGHGTCDDSDGSAGCVCDAGYEADGQGQCLVVGGQTGTTCDDPLILNPMSGGTSNDTTDAGDDADGICRTSTAPELVYTFTLDQPIGLAFESGGYDTVMYLRSACEDSNSEIACDDDGGDGLGSRLEVDLEPGTYYLFVDGYGDNAGAFDLQVDISCPAGTIPDPDTGACQADPCQPNPCQQEHKTVCEAILPDDFQCLCDPGYEDDGLGGCELNSEQKQWAVYVFLNADNNLEDYGYDDITEMVQAGSSDQVHIVVLLDSYDSDNGDARVLYVTPDGTEELDNWGEVDMGQPQTLADFGIWAVTHFPAEHTALIMWDHGDGWRTDDAIAPIKGFSHDDHPGGNSISISDGSYAFAMQQIVNTLGRKLDVLGFDACLMGTWEVAEASAPFGHYLVASSETEPADGWPYEEFLVPLVDNPGMTPEQLAVTIVDGYYDESTSNATQAATDLDSLADLESAMCVFADALRNHPDLYEAVEEVRQQTQKFYYFDDARDLTDFAERIAGMSGVPSDLRAAAENLVAQLQVSIVHSQAHSSKPGSHGLSVYLPGQGDTLDSAYLDDGAIWSDLTSWDEFLQDFTGS